MAKQQITSLISLEVPKERRLQKVKEVFKTPIQHQHPVRQLRDGYKPTVVEKRYNIYDQVGKPNPPWHAINFSDKDLGYFPLVQYRHYIHSPFEDTDGDGVLNIFDVKPLDPAVSKQVPPTVKEGNHKLNKVIGVFSLPRYWTCPGKTLLCTKYCYAEAPERFRPSVVYSRNKNEAWSLRPDFVDVVSRMIQSHEFPYFRIHESGDFYNQTYLEKWAEIARRNPNTTFLAYTKNYHLNYKVVPSNLTIRYSTDISSEHHRPDLSQCYVGVNKPLNFFSCKKKCEPGFCMACWDKEVDVYIPVHSVGKKQVDQMFFKQFNPKVPHHLELRRKNKREDYLGYKWGKEMSGEKKKEILVEMKNQTPVKANWSK